MLAFGGKTMLFMTPGLAAYIIAIKFLIGSVIGLVVAGLVYRSRFGLGVAVRGALFGVSAFCLPRGW
jgi:hypothetical protein